MKYLLTLISIVLLLSSCDNGEDTEFTETKASRAVMIYMAGENNLTSVSTSSGEIRFLQDDLNEIIKGSANLQKNQRVFVFVDSLGTNSQLRGTPYIIEVHGGKTYSRIKYTSDFYSSDPANFQQVISWMTSNVEADGYGLVLWGHASGWLVSKDTIPSTTTAAKRAYGVDTNADSGSIEEKWMNITQMAKALEGLPKLDFIFADCCNMMCAEVGYELRNATEYLIGSPAEIPGWGAPYHLVLPYFFKNGSELYKGIIDSYYNYYLDYYKQYSIYGLAGYSVPLAVIDTKYIETLAQTTRNILISIIPPYPDHIDLTGLPYYWYTSAPIFYDMKAAIKTHVDNEVYSIWEQAYNLAVPYSRVSLKWMSEKSSIRFTTLGEEYCGCVSMFFPQNRTGYTSGEYKLNQTANHFEWNRLMNWSRFGW